MTDSYNKTESAQRDDSTMFVGASQRSSYTKNGTSIADSARSSVVGNVASYLGQQIGAHGFLHSQQRDRLQMSRVGGEVAAAANQGFSGNAQRASYITYGGSIDRLAAVSANRSANNGRKQSIFVAADKFPHQGQRDLVDISRMAADRQVVVRGLGNN